MLSLNGDRLKYIEHIRAFIKFIFGITFFTNLQRILEVNWKLK